MGNPTRSGFVFKATTNGDLVVCRMIHLYGDDGKFVTFHDWEKDPSRRKTWYLDRRCVLSPENAADISDQPQRKLERQPGTWTITATATGSGREVKLFTFSVIWPSTWFNSGYSTFTLGVESLEEARAWHAALSECILKLRVRRMHKKSGEASSLAGDIAEQSSLFTEVGRYESFHARDAQSCSLQGLRCLILCPHPPPQAERYNRFSGGGNISTGKPKGEGLLPW